MTQMSALTLDWGKRAPIRRPWTVIRSFHREQAGEGKKWQKHPSNGHFPDQNTWVLLPSHKTTAPPNWRHSSELSGQGNPKCKAPAHQKPQVPRLPEAQRFPAQLERASKAKKRTAPPRPQGEDRLREGTLGQISGRAGKPHRQRRPWSLSSASPAAWSDLGRYTAPPKLLHFARPYFCQLSAVTAATSLTAGNPPPAREGKAASTVPPPPSPLSVLIPTPPPLPCPPNSQLREYSFLGLTASQTHIIHSFIQLASEGFLHTKELSQVLGTQGIESP